MQAEGVRSPPPPAQRVAGRLGSRCLLTNGRSTLRVRVKQVGH